MGVQFTRQHPVGNYIVDFACRRLRLAIECDGGQHAANTADVQRAIKIEAHGYRGIRFCNNEILHDTEGVLIRIGEEIALARNER